MKKLVVFFSFLVLFTNFNCENEPLEGDFVVDNGNSCSEANNEVQLAKANFNDAMQLNYSELCNAYKLALQNKLIICGEDPTVQDIIDSLGDCILEN